MRSGVRTPAGKSYSGVPVHFASRAAFVADGQEDGMEDQEPGEPAEIRIAVTPGGLLIASEDVEALDEFEELLRTVVAPSALVPQREITVFYLKYAKAEVASQLIQEILGGRTDSGDLGGSLLGDMASNLLGGGLMGGLLGGLAGGGDSEGGTTTIQASGTVSMVPDPRLNALVIQANEEDLKLIEDLLKVIDREGSITEVQTAGVPRVIPIVYGSADEAAAIVRQVFADRISSGSGSQQRQPSPEDLIRALRGGRGSREQSQARGEEQKMTVGVDQRSNSLIITGPEHLFQQVESLVQQIDQPGSSDSDVVSVVPIRVSDPEVVQKTLASILATSASSSTQRPSSGNAGGQRPSGSGFSPDQMRQRMEFLQRLQGMGGARPGTGGAPGGGARPGMRGGGGPGGGRGGR
jgi:hypothetical protein